MKEEIDTSIHKNSQSCRLFKFNPEKYEIPENALKLSPLYMTSNMEYGRMKPNKYEVSRIYYPKSNRFTEKHKNTLYKFTCLNTHKENHPVHDLLDLF